jgi:hypothetical protein
VVNAEGIHAYSYFSYQQACGLLETIRLVSEQG